jgi:hypothetical protein
MISLNFIGFLLSFFLILISVLGYGFLFLRINKINKNLNFGYLGLFGIFFLITYSYLSNLFLPHSQFHNSIIIILGIVIFFYYIIKDFNNHKLNNEILFCSLLFIILFLSLLMIKNHDDFSYYHFQYTYYLTQDSFSFGVGQFNHGFRTPSSIFYLNSLFYLPIVDYYLFNFSSALILGFANIIFLKKIGTSLQKIKFTFSNNKTLFIKYLSLFSLVFINIFFYRISEHGTDRSAQILILILIVELYEFFLKEDFQKYRLAFLYFLFGIIVSLKAFYFLYLVFLIPIFLYVLKNKKNFYLTFKYLFFNRFFLFVFLLICLIIFSYFSNTGCLLYPLNFTCFEKFKWTIPSHEVVHMNNWYELWSKGGANPNFRVESPDQYIKGFNWVNNWFDQYFFNKMSDFILGIFSVVLLFFIIFLRPKLKHKFFFVNNFIISIYLIIFFILIEWFCNHPSLRYGGYCVIALLFFIPSSYLLSSYNINLKKFSQSVIFLVFLTFVIFLIRNINRLDNEVKKYQYKPLKETYYSIDKKYFIIQDKMNMMKKKYKDCKKSSSKCDSHKVSMIYSRFIFEY